MPWKKNRQAPNLELVSDKEGTDQEALLHEAYMLVRHLQACYPDSTKDEELSVRLTRLFDHQFSPSTVKRLVVEAFSRPFIQPSTKDAQVHPENDHLGLSLPAEIRVLTPTS